jgi:hypothetical protein
MSATLAEVLARFGPSYLAGHGLSAAQAKAWRAIEQCAPQRRLPGPRAGQPRTAARPQAP